MKSPSAEMIKNTVIEVLKENKGEHIVCYDTSSETVSDYVIIVTAISTRHASKLADSLIQEIKANKLGQCAVEGKRISDWILVDIGKVIVQILVAETRVKYDLEGLLESLNSKLL